MRRLVGILLLSLALESRAATSVWVEVAAGQMDTRLLTPRARRVVSAPEFNWRHAQTGRFVVHFENGIFAAKVGRLGDFFYDYIAADLTGLRDLAEGRSHIFIFRKPADWKNFLQSHGAGVGEWTFSFVEGSAMYLQQASDIGSSATVLGHEMTHLVINRFLPQRLPLWLNEGVAEWYGEFAYAEYKGVKKSRRTAFRPLARSYSVPTVLRATAYPADPREVQAFYLFAKNLVSFLQLERAGAFPPFLRDAGAGDAMPALLAKHYGFADEAAFEQEFWKFAR